MNEMQPQPLAILAIVADFPELRAALIARRHEMHMPQSVVDDIAGLAGGFTGKLECGLKNYGPISLGAILGALKVKLALVRDCAEHSTNSEQFLRARARSHNYYSMIGTRGARVRNARLSDDEMSKAMSHAAKVRWARVRAKRRAQAAAEEKIRRAKIKRKVKEPA